MPLSASERLWRGVTNRLAREASIRVTRTYLQYAQGALTLEEAIGIQATMIASAQRRAVTANDLILAAELTERLEREYAATGIQWMEDADAHTARLSKAVSTVLGDDVAYIEAAAVGKTPEQVKQLQAQSIRARLTRLATGEVTEASQWARQTAMQVWEEQGVVTGWYRRTSPSACAFCRTLQGPGDPATYIHPPQHRLASHAGCTCSQGIWTGELEPWQKFLGPRAQMRTLFPEGRVPGEAAS